MNDSGKAKKKNTLQLLLIVIGVFVVLSTMGGCNSNDGRSPNVSKNIEASDNREEGTSESNSTPEEPAASFTTKYSSGMYKAGSDIPPGEYIAFADFTGNGYVEITSSSSGRFEDIIANENFSYNTIFTIKSGNYLKILNAYVVPSAEVRELDTSGEGMFKVGVHLKPGEYKLISSSDLGGYYQVDSNSLHSLHSIVANDNFQNNAYVTVRSGQYLKLTNCTIVR